MDIESLATAAVKDSISWTDRLVPYISEKDKEPIWDGSVHVYSSPVKSNDNHLGRVPTQVKGKNVSEFMDSERYDVAVCELKRYLSEGGVIFFVVELSERTKDTKIFYSSLLPYDLQTLIDAAGQQIYKRIKLLPFPTEDDKMIDVFTNFLAAKKKQFVTSSLERIVPIEELVKQANPKNPGNLSFSLTESRPEKDILDRFIGNGMYLYFNTPEGVSFPIEHLVNIHMVGMNVEESISCQGKKYYDHYSRTRNKDFYELSFGKAFSFKTDNKQESLTFNITISGTLCERITECEFVIAMLQEKGFHIGNGFVSIDESIMDSNMIETWQGNLALLNSIKSALDFMGVIEDLDYDKLTEDDCKKIRYWLLPAADGKPVQLDAVNSPFLSATFVVCNLNILVLLLRQADGRYILKNFFAENEITSLAEDGSRFTSSCYTLLEKNDFLRLSNLDYSLMAEKMKLDSPHRLYANKVNCVAWDLLSAYDETSRPEILHTAQELTDWLCSIDNHDIIFRLNHLQSIKRERKLDTSDRHWLYSVVTEEGIEDVCKMEACILLEDYSEATIYYDRLTQEMRNEYDAKPIMALWKR